MNMMKKKLTNIVSLILILLFTACEQNVDINKEEVSMRLFLASDNYPKGYKKYFGELSYTRCLLLAFVVKNSTNHSVLFPCASSLYSSLADENNSKIRICYKNRFADTDCTQHPPKSSIKNGIIPAGDSIAIAIRLWPSEINELGIDLDNDSIESIVQNLSFSYIPPLDSIQEIKSKIIKPIFLKNKRIIFRHGNLYIYENNGKRVFKEIYDGDDLRTIKKIRQRSENRAD